MTETFPPVPLLAALGVAGCTIVAAATAVLLLALRNRKYKYLRLLTMEELLARGKALLAEHQELQTVTFVHMAPGEIPERHLPRKRVPKEVRHVILAAVEENGQPKQILDVILCADLEESLQDLILEKPLAFTR